MSLPRVAHIGWLASSHLRRRAGELARRGVPTVVFTDSLPQHLHKAALPYQVEILPSELYSQPFELVKWIEQRLYAHDIHLLHIHSTHFPAALGFFVRTIPRITSIWDFVHSKDSVSPLYHRVFLDELLAGRLSEAISFSSSVLHERWISEGFPESRAFWHSWGVDSRYFRPAENRDEIDCLRQELGIASDQKIIFSPRTPSLPANVDLLLQALTQLKDVHCIVTGHAFPPEARYLERLVRRRGIAEKVHFIDTVRQQETLSLHYQLADLVVSLHSNDHNPATVLEAMASGSLVLINESDTVEYWIKDGRNGLVARTRDLKHLVRKISQALDLSHDLQERWRRYNQEKVSSQANFHNTISSLIDHYRLIRELPSPSPCSSFHRGLLADLCNRLEEALFWYRKAEGQVERSHYLPMLAHEKMDLLAKRRAIARFHMRRANPLILKLADLPRRKWSLQLQSLSYPKSLYRHDVIAGFYPLMEADRLEDILVLTELLAQRFHTDTLEWQAECINWFGNRWGLHERCANLLLLIKDGGTSLGIHALSTARALGQEHRHYEGLLQRAARWTSSPISFLHPDLDRRYRRKVHEESIRLLSTGQNTKSALRLGMR